MDSFSVTCFAAKELATKAIHYKTAIYLGVMRNDGETLMYSKFVFEALPYELFNSYFEMSSEELSKTNASLIVVDANPGYPCRVTLEDAEVGERVVAVSYKYHDVNSPYLASGPIFCSRKCSASEI